MRFWAKQKILQTDVTVSDYIGLLYVSALMASIMYNYIYNRLIPMLQFCLKTR